eukprot:5454-Pleurochrysis_carterae.AAC.1
MACRSAGTRPAASAGGGGDLDASIFRQRQCSWRGMLRFGLHREFEALTKDAQVLVGPDAAAVGHPAVVDVKNKVHPVLVVVILEEVARVELGLRKFLYFDELLLRVSMPDAPCVGFAVKRFEKFQTMGTPRSSKCRSPGGRQTYTSPSSPSNRPCRYAASTANCRM